ncbi:MAG: aromatase/cyclase [Actinomycetota bacterium]|nr:aromatase/cyclase [Actinomycetota bacterium]MDQ2958043.1 aromatase/cyclase [Actinomycetota bacterium]
MTVREVEHEITVAAPAPAVYRLIAEVTNWPRIFPPTIYVDRFDHDESSERIRIWATANGEVKSWTSMRTLDAAAHRITFRQEVSTPPVAAMGGAWVIEALPDGHCRVRLQHDYRAVDDDPAGLAWIDEAVDRNSRSELAALKANLESATAEDLLVFSFEDSLRMRGSAEAAYDFVNAADLWPQRLPHVASVRLREDTAGLQDLQMETRAGDGSTHTTRSFRICQFPRRIAYKQVTLPALMTLHTGLWSFRPEGSGELTASSQHTVAINPEAIARVLGPAADVADAKRYLHTALSTNSLATLRHAKDHVESAASLTTGSGRAGS